MGKGGNFCAELTCPCSLQLYPAVDPEAAAAAVVEELKADEWNLSELERLQQQQVRWSKSHT